MSIVKLKKKELLPSLASASILSYPKESPSTTCAFNLFLFRGPCGELLDRWLKQLAQQTATAAIKSLALLSRGQFAAAAAVAVAECGAKVHRSLIGKRNSGENQIKSKISLLVTPSNLTILTCF